MCYIKCDFVANPKDQVAIMYTYYERDLCESLPTKYVDFEQNTQLRVIKQYHKSDVIRHNLETDRANNVTSEEIASKVLLLFAAVLTD